MTTGDDDHRGLPVLGGIFARAARLDGPPTLDQARTNLGGPWLGGRDVGRVVELSGRRFGVVIHGEGEQRDVYVGMGRIARLAAESLVDFDAPDAELEAIAADARVHMSLVSGGRVAFEARDGTVGEGELLEKLRYGALVRTDDGRALAVSFRKIAPVASTD